MKVLLVYTNRYKLLRPAPIGIAYLARALVEAKHDVEVVDMLFAKNPQSLLDTAVKRFSPDVIGFSIRNLDNQDMEDTYNPLPEIREYVRSVKQTGIPPVLGGSAFSTFPAEMLDYMGADYGISGQGERSFVRLIEALKSRSDISDISGLTWRVNGKVQVNTPDLSGYNGIHPDWRPISLSSYRKGLFFLNTMVKSGCPFECTYCNVGCTIGKTPVCTEIGRVVNDIKTAIQTTGIRSFFMTDPCFSYPADYAKNLLKAIAEADLKVQLFTSVVPVSGCYDDEFFDLYKRAGGDFCILGSESLSPSMLKAYRKPFTVDDVIRWSALAKKTKLRYGIDLMLGGPGENKETIQESVAALGQLSFTMMMYGMGIRILPHTPLAEIAIQEKIIDSHVDLFFPKFYMSKDLDPVWAKAYLKTEFKKYRRRLIGIVPVGVRNLVKRYGW